MTETKRAIREREKKKGLRQIRVLWKQKEKVKVEKCEI